jgi:hypothetical protein
MGQNPINEVGSNFATRLLGTAWQPQLFTPPLSEHRNRWFAGMIGAVRSDIAGGHEIYVSTEGLKGNILQDLIMIRIEPDRTANYRSTGHGLDSAYATD